MTDFRTMAYTNPLRSSSPTGRARAMPFGPWGFDSPSRHRFYPGSRVEPARPSAVLALPAAGDVFPREAGTDSHPGPHKIAIPTQSESELVYSVHSIISISVGILPCQLHR